MLGQSVMDAADPSSATAIDGSLLKDKSMQVLEYLVASIAVIAAVALAFLR